MLEEKTITSEISSSQPCCIDWGLRVLLGRASACHDTNSLFMWSSDLLRHTIRTCVQYS